MSIFPTHGNVLPTRPIWSTFCIDTLALCTIRNNRVSLLLDRDRCGGNFRIFAFSPSDFLPRWLRQTHPMCNAFLRVPFSCVYRYKIARMPYMDVYRIAILVVCNDALPFFWLKQFRREKLLSIIKLHQPTAFPRLHTHHRIGPLSCPTDRTCSRCSQSVES